MRRWWNITTAILLSLTISFADLSLAATNIIEETTLSAPINSNIEIHHKVNLNEDKSFAVGSVLADGYQQVFIALMDNSNQIIWQKTANGGGHYGNKAMSVTKDSQGFIYVTGNHSGNLEIDNNLLASDGVVNMFTIKYNSNGDIIWIKQAKGSQYENQVRAEKVEIINDYVVVSGLISGKVVFDDMEITGNGTYEARYDKNGNLIEVKTIN